MSDSVLVITRNLPPLIGGMERLTEQAIAALSSQYSVSAVGPMGSTQATGLSALEEVDHRSPLGFIWQATRAGFRQAAKYRPGIVIAASGLAAPAAYLVSRRYGIPLIVFVHGLDLVHFNPGYRLLCLPAIRAAERVISNSSNTSHLAENIGIDRQRISVLHPGVEISQSGMGISSVLPPVLLFVGRVVKRKGLVPFIVDSFPRLLGEVPDLRLQIVGNNAQDALHHKGEAGHARQVIAELGLTANVDWLGSVSDKELQDCYARASALILPLQDIPGDVEGFGMVAVEAASQGTPTVAYNCGGVADAIEQGKSGYLVESGDVEGFTQVTLNVLRGNGPAMDSCRHFALGFSWQHYAEKLNQLVDAELLSERLQ